MAQQSTISGQTLYLFMQLKNLWINLIFSSSLSLLFIFSGTDSIGETLRSNYFYSDLTISFLLLFSLLVYIKGLTKYLERKYNWQEQFIARGTSHLILGVVLPSLVVFVAMYIYFFMIYDFKQEEIHFFYTEYPFAVIVIIAVNFAYSAYFFYQENKKNQDDLIKLKQQLFTLQNLSNTSGSHKEDASGPGLNAISGKIRTFIAVSGNKNIPIPVEEICCFYKDGNYARLKTFESKTYLLNHTLDDLMQALDESLFFRVNRQFIGNRKACNYFTTEDNGKLELFLNPEHDQEIIISQKRAPIFKEWINK